MKGILMLLAIIVFLFIMCDPRTKTEDYKDSLLLEFPDKGEDTLKVSYFADTVIYVPLETTKESLVGFSPQLWVNDSIILISGSKSEILMFNREGKFLRKIGKRGRGPGEYQEVFHFDVINDTIYISSTGKRSFIRYAFNGKFCDEIKLKFQPVVFNCTADNQLVYYNMFDGKIYVYKNIFVKPDTIPVEYGVSELRYNFTNGSDWRQYFQKTESGLLFTNYINDTIWEINGTNKEPAHILAIKDKLLPWNYQREYFKLDYEGWKRKAIQYIYIHPIEFQSFSIFFQIKWALGVTDAIYLKNNRTGEMRRFNYRYLYDDLVGKQNLRIVSLTYSPNYLITISQPAGKLRDLKKEKGPSQMPSKLWLKKFQDIKEDDNPVLAFIKVKGDSISEK